MFLLIYKTQNIIFLRTLHLQRFLIGKLQKKLAQSQHIAQYNFQTLNKDVSECEI